MRDIIKVIDVINPNQPKAEPPATRPKPPAPNAKKYGCEMCQAIITEKVYNYSVDKYKMPVCFDCQKNFKKEPEENQPSIEEQDLD